ncbi:MAG TPA: class I SAM-dependent methyltransferase [Burkholderiales bacterium]|nr:class I SAM-dependent methyltransferase [Burkholderiales bacterium]
MVSRRRFLSATGCAAVTAALSSYASLSRAAAETEVPNAMASWRPSATAQGAAMLRAIHQVVDDPLVLADPLALKIIGPEAEASILANPASHDTRRALRAFVVLRSRYAEDELARAVDEGVGQYVLLGAGLDTFGYRNAHRRLKVFEVDHPATQRWKRERLSAAQIAVPESVTYAPVDFERETLAQGLTRAGFDPSRPAFFSMLGVAVYLTKPALRDTLAYVASLAQGTGIVFSYGVSNDLLTESQKRSRTQSALRVADLGEPWLSYYEPAALAWDLMDIGFGKVTDVDGATANLRYFRGRADGLRVSSTSRLMAARV